MSTIWKLILLAVLIVVVVAISVNSVREMDYSLTTDTTSVENSMENSVSLYDDSTFVKNEYVDTEKSATPAVSNQPADNGDNSVNTLTPQMSDESNSTLSTFTTAATTETSVVDTGNTPQESTKETQVIILDGGTETTLATNESSVMNFTGSSDEIYGEMTSLEQSVRKYLSGGHKISMLNSETLYKGGYINGDLADKYNVSFRINGDGYDIVITPKYAIDSSIIDLLTQKDKVKKADMGIEYIFWIRAYKG